MLHNSHPVLLTKFTGALVLRVLHYYCAHFRQVLNGQSWVLVDGAILDVSEFAQRHPGGRCERTGRSVFLPWL